MYILQLNTHIIVKVYINLKYALRLYLKHK